MSSNKKGEINDTSSQTTVSKNTSSNTYVIVNNNNFQIMVDKNGKDNPEDILVIGSRASVEITTEYSELSKSVIEQYGNTVHVAKL